MRMLGAIVLLLALPQEGPDERRIRDRILRLEDDRLEERAAAAEALQALDPSALPVLRGAVPALSGEAKERLLAVIGHIEHRARVLQATPRTPMVVLPGTPLPFKEAFEALRRQSKLPLQLAEDLPGKDRVVRAEPGRVSWWEAVDRLLTAHGAASIEVEDESLLVVPGARRTGTHRGPHAAWIQALRVDEERDFREPASSASCTLELAAAWEPGGPTPCRILAQVVDALDETGASLIDVDPDQVGWALGHGIGSKVPWQTLDLGLPVAPAAESAVLSRLRVRVEFHYAVERSEFKLDLQSPGRRSASSNGFVLVLNSLRNDEGPWTAQCRIQAKPEEVTDVLVESARLVDKDGHAHGAVFSYEVAADEDGNLPLLLSFPQMPPKAEPRRLEVRLATKLHVEALDLDLKDLPLASP